jgi:hypothetical protein
MVAATSLIGLSKYAEMNGLSKNIPPAVILKLALRNV